MAELAYARDLKSRSERIEGSSPSSPTIKQTALFYCGGRERRSDIPSADGIARRCPARGERLASREARASPSSPTTNELNGFSETELWAAQNLATVCFLDKN